MIYLEKTKSIRERMDTIAQCWEGAPPHGRSADGAAIMTGSGNLLRPTGSYAMAPRIIRFLIWVALIACGFWILNAVVSMIWFALR